MKKHYAIKRDGKFKHFPQENYNTELNKSCLFVNKGAAEKNASSLDKVVLIELREVPKELWGRY
ncbi:hypothetical protein ACYSNR_03175 [Enterococcus sp. LJL128]